MVAMALMLLKILGIILLSIFLLALLVLLLVFFVPICYVGDVKYKGKVDIDAHVHWLLRFLFVKIEFHEEIKVVVKIFWCIKVFTIPKSLEKKKEERKDLENADKESGDGVEDTLTEDKESVPIEKETKKKISPKKKNKKEKEENWAEGIKKKLRAFAKRFEEIKAFILDENNHRLFSFLMKMSYRLLGHILPRRVSGRFRFGFVDPATMGQVLSYLAAFYGIYRERFLIIPVFDEEVMEADIAFRGRITIGYLVYIVVKVWFNKDFQKLYKQFKG